MASHHGSLLQECWEHIVSFLPKRDVLNLALTAQKFSPFQNELVQSLVLPPFGWFNDIGKYSKRWYEPFSSQSLTR